MKHLRDLDVLVLGLGHSGLAMARWCARHGAPTIAELVGAVERALARVDEAAGPPDMPERLLAVLRGAGLRGARLPGARLPAADGACAPAYHFGAFHRVFGNAYGSAHQQAALRISRGVRVTRLAQHLARAVDEQPHRAAADVRHHDDVPRRWLGGPQAEAGATVAA